MTPGYKFFYKVVADNDWFFNWGFNGENASYVVTLPEDATLPEGNEKGIFDITFKFNPLAKFANGFNVDCTVEYDAATTAITTVKTDRQTEGIFNLNGQKVEKAQKGLYIINGKMVVMK